MVQKDYKLFPGISHVKNPVAQGKVSEAQVQGGSKARRLRRPSQNGQDTGYFRMWAEGFRDVWGPYSPVIRGSIRVSKGLYKRFQGGLYKGYLAGYIYIYIYIYLFIYIYIGFTYGYIGVKGSRLLHATDAGCSNWGGCMLEVPVALQSFMLRWVISNEINQDSNLQDDPVLKQESSIMEFALQGPPWL